MSRPNINATVQGASTGNPCTYVTKVLKGNIPFAEQIGDTNTKYVIKWDFDLGGATLTIPEGCLIEMDGGSISNGTMVGDHTILIYFQELSDCIKSVTMQGTWKYNNPRDGIFTENVYDETQQKTQKQVNSDVAESLGTLDDKIDDKTDINATFSEDGKIYADFKAGDIFYVEVDEEKKYRVAYADGIADDEHPVTITGMNFYYADNSADAIFFSLRIKSVSVDPQTLLPNQKVQAQNNIVGKSYVPAEFSGLGKKVFAKNIQEVGGVDKNIMTQAFFQDGQDNPLTNTIFVIQYDYDLMGETIEVPEGCTLNFDGGSLRNGIIIGNGTSIVAEVIEIFDDIKIQGNWNVETIYSEWFKNVESYDVIRDIFNLTSDSCHNEVIINDKGLWNITITVFDYETGSLYIKPNTHIQLDGTIKLNTTSNSGYYMIQIKGDDVSITGKGRIIGKSDNWETGGGQTGMGIGIFGAENVVINGITLEYHRGDAIRVGGILVDGQPKPSRNVIIQNCIINYIHENGIAVIGADNTSIQNCSINNATLSAGGLGPAAAIDIENSNDDIEISNTHIENVHTKNCRRGLSIYDDSEIGVIKNVRVSNYRAVNCSNIGLRLGYNISSIVVNNSYFSAVTDVLNAFALYDDESHEFSQVDLQYNVVLENCTFHKLEGDSRDTPILADIRHPNISLKTCKFISDTNDGVENYGSFRLRDNLNIPTYVENTQITCRKVVINKPIHLKNSIVQCVTLDDNAEGSIYESNILKCYNTAKAVRSFSFSGRGLMMKNNIVRAFIDISCSGSITDNDFATPEQIRAGRYESFSDEDHKLTSLLILGPKKVHEYTTLSRNVFHCDDLVEGFISSCVYITQRPLEEGGPNVGFDFSIVSENIFYLRNVTYGLTSPSGYIYNAISVINNTGIADTENPDSGGYYRLAGVLYNNLYRTKTDNKNYFKGIARFLLRDRGFTSERPSFVNDGDAKQYTGFKYFDTDLGKPIWWNGTAWVDATGATV